MTKKDYVALAAALNLGRFDGMDSVRTAIHADYVARIANVLAQDNPSFDRARFLAAAGVKSKADTWSAAVLAVGAL